MHARGSWRRWRWSRISAGAHGVNAGGRLSPLSKSSSLDEDPYVILPERLHALLSSAIRHKIQAANGEIMCYADPGLQGQPNLTCHMPPGFSPATARLYQAGSVDCDDFDFSFAISCVRGGDWAGDQVCPRSHSVVSSDTSFVDGILNPCSSSHALNSSGEACCARSTKIRDFLKLFPLDGSNVVRRMQFCHE